MIALDTNVFVYGVDSTDAAKQTTAAALILEHTGSKDAVLLWQVAAELLRWLRSAQDRGDLSEHIVEQTFRKVRQSFRLTLPREAVLDAAIECRRRHSLSHWDSMLLAACIDAGVGASIRCTPKTSRTASSTMA